jgi:hypothetical protein
VFNEERVIELTHAAFSDADQNQVTVAYQCADAAPGLVAEEVGSRRLGRSISNARGREHVGQ